MASTEQVVRVLRDDNEAIAAELVRQEGGFSAALRVKEETWLTPAELRAVGQAAIDMATWLDDRVKQGG